MAKIKKIVKGTSIASKIQAATENLLSAKADGEAALSLLGGDRKKLLAENKRLIKKRGILTRKKQAAASRLKKTPNAENRKAASSITKELAAIKKAADKARAAKSANAEEYNAVKTALKQASTYVAVIEKADKLLNKPRKKVRRKRRVVAA